jgi:hypothetical protein
MKRSVCDRERERERETDRDYNNKHRHKHSSDHYIVKYEFPDTKVCMLIANIFVREASEKLYAANEQSIWQLVDSNKRMKYDEYSIIKHYAKFDELVHCLCSKNKKKQ